MWAKAMNYLVCHQIIPLSAAESGIVQRAPPVISRPITRGWSSKASGAAIQRNRGSLHPGLQCYREIPPPEVTRPATRSVSSKKTGKFVEESPDFISAVSGQKKDGTCDIPLGITDPPHPFSQRGRRPLGHGIADIATEDPDIIGRHFGRISGVAMGIALPNVGSRLGDAAITAILGFVGGKLGERGLPLLNRLAEKHGFLPTISLGAGSNLGLGLGVGFEKRDRPLPLVPINTYLTLGLDSSLADEPGGSYTFLAKVGVRIDPGKQGGLFAVGSVGAGAVVGSDVFGATSAELGVGYRAILDSEVTTGARQDNQPYLGQIQRVRDRYKLTIDEATTDRGYGSAEIIQSLKEQGIKPYIPLWNRNCGRNSGSAGGT